MLGLIIEIERERDRRILAYFGISSVAAHSGRHAMFRALSTVLAELTTEDVTRLGSAARELPAILLGASSAADVDRILNRWRYGPALDPGFAESILASLPHHVERHEGWKEELLLVLLPVALSNVRQTDTGASALRKMLMSNYPEVLARHPELETAYWRDVEREESARRESERKAKAYQADQDARHAASRMHRIAEISAMPFQKRVDLLRSGGVGVDGPYPDSWGEITPGELQSLDDPARQQLVRLLRGSRSKILRRIRSVLRAVDQAVEAKHRESLAKELSSLSVVEQLEHLASSGIPLRRYPVSLAHAGIEHSDRITADLHQRLLARLAGQHGAWGSLFKAVRAAGL